MGLATSEKLYLPGGATPIGVPNGILVYDISLDTWEYTFNLSLFLIRIANTINDNLLFCAHAEIENKAFFAGGQTGNKAVSSRIDTYDLATDTWSTVDRLSR